MKEVPPPSVPTPTPGLVRRIKLVVTLATIAIVAGAYGIAPSFRSAVNRAVMTLAQGDVLAIRDYILSYGIWAPLISALLMVLQALIAPLPAVLITFANGLAFGALWGGLLTFGSAVLAAAICFWLARVLGRTAVEALVGKTGLTFADGWFARWGNSAVLVARLVPVISFDLISFAAGLTAMRFSGFLVATMVGMTPATIVYSYLGEQAPHSVPYLLAACGILAAGALLASIRSQRRG